MPYTGYVTSDKVYGASGCLFEHKSSASVNRYVKKIIKAVRAVRAAQAKR
jgi:hypothetical protein